MGLAKLVIAPDCGSGGHEFDSHISPLHRDVAKRLRHEVLILACAGSSPAIPVDPLAQLVEHLTFNQGAEGSSPSWVIEEAS